MTPHPKGSNGDVHRGVDNFPRLNVMQAIVLMTLAAFGYNPKDLPGTMRELQARRRKARRTLIPAAAVHLMVEANLNIIIRAAMGDDRIYGRSLTLQRDFHRIMAGGNGKDPEPGRIRRSRASRRPPAHRGRPSIGGSGTLSLILNLRVIAQSANRGSTERIGRRVRAATGTGLRWSGQRYWLETGAPRRSRSDNGASTRGPSSTKPRTFPRIEHLSLR